MSAAASSPPPDDAPPKAPPVHTCVRQISTERVGRVRAYAGATKLTLRPLDGGPEWDAEIDDLTPITTGEALRVAIVQVNTERMGPL